MQVPLENPSPDFESLKRVLKGERAKKVHFVELGIDKEIKEYITENLLGKKWIPLTSESKENYWKQEIYFWYKMGYDYIRVSGGLDFPTKYKESKDTATLSREKRNWIEEGKGMISSWEEFEKYPWPKLEDMNFSQYEFVSKNLPEGMKIMVCPSSGVFEIASESLLGFENMSYLLIDHPDLVEAAFNKLGETICTFYQNILDLENVEGIFQGDDLGCEPRRL